MKGSRLFYIALSLIILLSVAASYYKFVVLSDYETIFLMSCDEGEFDCFQTLAYCEEGMDPEECTFIYKAYVIEQNTLDTQCEVDEGECLEEICSEADQCKIIYCTDPAAANYDLTDECAS